MATPADSNILALDVGSARIGVAIAHAVARLPRPLTTLPHTEDVLDDIAKLVQSEHVGQVVIGLPRNLSGDATPQTAVVQGFAAALASKIMVPISMQDEALTSVKAEEELRARHTAYTKADVDALAATYILGDYLHTHQGVS